MLLDWSLSIFNIISHKQHVKYFRCKIQLYLPVLQPLSFRRWIWPSSQWHLSASHVLSSFQSTTKIVLFRFYKEKNCLSRKWSFQRGPLSSKCIASTSSLSDSCHPLVGRWRPYQKFNALLSFKFHSALSRNAKHAELKSKNWVMPCLKRKIRIQRGLFIQIILRYQEPVFVTRKFNECKLPNFRDYGSSFSHSPSKDKLISEICAASCQVLEFGTK